MLDRIASSARFGRMQLRSLGLAATVQYKAQRMWGRIARRTAPYALRSRRAMAPLWVRPASSDLMVFDQIFVDREYRCLDDVADAEFIIDCGANVGYSTAYLLSRYPAARAVAVEPESRNFEALRRNLAPYGARAEAIRAGVWSRPTGLVVEVHDTRSGRDWAFTVREAAPGEPPDVQATDLTTVWRDAGEPTISILKMDIEGSETVVFGAAEKPWLAAVENMVVELHGPDCERALAAAIDGLGFDVTPCGELTICKRRLRR